MPTYNNGYIRQKNNHPISFDTEGNLVDQVSGEKGTMILPGFNVIGISPKTRARNYSSAYHPEDALEFFDIMTRPITAPITPSTQVGAIRNALNGGSYYKSLMGIEPNLGITTENFNREHPYLSMGANLGFDVVVPFGPKAIKGGITVTKELPYLFPKTRLYSDNPFVNAYATLARRYNLPDKARLPYLIRKIQNGDLSFTENGLVDLTGNRWKHTNYTYDLGVIPHEHGSWDTADQTLIINPRNFIKRNKWGNIEPSDMFTIDDTTPVDIDEVINITGVPEARAISKAHGISTFSSKKLNEIKLKELKGFSQDSKGFDWSKSQPNTFISLDSPMALSKKSRPKAIDREQYNAVQEIIDKFGRPKVKDVRLLEEMTGLKSYIHPIEDAQLFRQIDYDAIMNTPINQMEEVINNLPVFNNGRRFNYRKASNYRGVQYPYRNFFYDPVTTAESKFQFPSSDVK